MRIKRYRCKRYRTLVYFVIIFIVGKLLIWTLIANSHVELRESNSNGFWDILQGVRYGIVRALRGSSLDSAICEGARLPKHLVINKDTWTPVDSKQSAYVLNAYLIEPEQKIVVIGAKTSKLKSAACLFWYTHSNNTVTVIQEPSDHLYLPEGRFLRYSAHLFMCNLKRHGTPDYVSIVTSHCTKPLHLLQIQPTFRTEDPKRKFTVCLSPLNYNYSRAYELIEWIELNRILGAEKFVIYNYSSASNVASVLDFYSKRGITEVVQWRLPMKVQKFTTNEVQEGDIYYFGQLAALNDCLYRQKQYSEFVVNLDLDEFIVPRQEGIHSWSDIMKYLENEKIAGAYLFRNVFFRKDWVNKKMGIDDEKKVNRFRLTTLQKLERENEAFQPGHRSKYFARTADANSLMIHTVVNLPADKPPVAFSEQVALLHHYRNWEVYSKDGHDVIVDKTVPDKYSKILLQNVETIWSSLPKGTKLE